MMYRTYKGDGNEILIYRSTSLLSHSHNHWFSSIQYKVVSNDQLIDSICLLRGDVDQVPKYFYAF